MTESAKKRTFETQLEIAAPMEDVWKALTEADELTRWFPLEAKVTPGPGGSVEMGWPLQNTVWDSRIEIWEPNRRLRSVGVPRDAGGSSEKLTPLVLDYFLETSGGKTILRLVHTGFRSGSDWDNEYFESFHRGWDFELRGLRHYLERHRGERRAVAWARQVFQIPFDEAWARLMGPRAVLKQGSLQGLREGDHYAITAATGDVFEGIVQVNTPPKQFAGTVETRNDSLLRVKLDPAAGGGDATVWLSTYGVPQADVDSFQKRWSDVLQQVFS
jgi:uncharacterized protein YndB with AHSA1/START domain